MTFGKIKSVIENNLLESYKKETEFKKNLREFRHNVLNNKSFSKAYAIYDQLSTPQGLTESDAKEFLDEAVSLLNKILPTIKLPKTINESLKNSYSDIDTLVYTKTISIKERLQAKKNIINVLTKSQNKVQESVNIPVSSMVKIANQTLENYISEMDEDSKKTFMDIIKSDTSKLQENFSQLKEKTLGKLSEILNKEAEKEIVEKLNETIEKLKTEEFNQINYVKLLNLEKSL